MISIFFQSILVLVNGTVIDGTGAPARANTVVEITDGRIVRIGRVSEAGDYQIPEGCRRLRHDGEVASPRTHRYPHPFARLGESLHQPG